MSTATVVAANSVERATGLAVPPSARHTTRRDSEGWIYFGLGLLTAAAWWLSSLRLFPSKSDIGYWIGVAGGVAMLGVFAYPMRKHLRFMQRWGAAKYWFVVHMSVGVIGPLLILIHSNFRVGSINGGAALYSMVVVAISGVVGRFLYVRVHSGLHGQKLSMGELQKHIHGDEQVVAKLRFAPRVQERLLEFERAALADRPSALRLALGGSLVLSMRRWRTSRRCRAELRDRMLVLAKAQGWSKRDYRRRIRAARALVVDYLKTVQRLAELTAWERVFALWHVLHVPFVYLMVATAVVHVVAVHAY